MKNHLNSILIIACLGLPLSGQADTDLHVSASPQVDTVDNPILKQGMVFEEKKEWNKAVELYLNYLSTNPTRIDLLDRVALIQYSFLNDPLASAKTYSKITELEPNNAKAWASLSLKWQFANKPLASFEAINRAIQLEPDNLAFYEKRIMLAFWLNKYDVVKESYTKILNTDPQNPVALNARADYFTYLSQWSEAVKALEVYLKAKPDDTKAIEQYIKALTYTNRSKDAKKILKEKTAVLPPEKYVELDSWIEKNHNIHKTLTSQSFAWMIKEAQKYGLQHFMVNRLPEKGLKAENQEQRNEAIRVYKQYTITHPEIWETWFRLGMLYSSQNNSISAAHALEKVSARFSNNVKLLNEIAQQYVNASQSNNSIAERNRAIQYNISNVRYINGSPYSLTQIKYLENAYAIYLKILNLEPYNTQYLLSAADVFIALEQYDLALNAYNTVLHKYPKNRAALQGMIDLYLAQDKLEKTLNGIYIYLSYYPQDKKQYILAANIKIWQEAFNSSYKILQDYRIQFGADFEYQKTLVYLYSQAGRPDLSNYLLTPLLARNPNNYDLIQSKTYADYNSNHILSSLISLKKLNKLQPYSSETRRVNEEILTPLRSNIAGDGYFYRGSDSVKIARGGLTGTYFLSPITYLDAGFSSERVSAAADSGLTPIASCCDISFANYWLGGKHRFSPKLALKGRLGNNQIYHQSSNLYYLAEGEFRYNDYLNGSLGASRSLFDTSPLALSLGINQNLYGLNLNLRPGLQSFLEFSAQFSTYSDSNNRWLTRVYPHQTIFVYEKFKLDLGVEGIVFGFKEQLDTGYYDPSLYEFYAVVAKANLGTSRNTNYFFRVAMGPQKDNTFTNYGLGYDLTAEAEYGIYKDWYLNASGTYSNRLSGAALVTTPANRFNSYNIDAKLVRRFGVG